MAETKGIKETKEALVAIVALGKFVLDRVKDGVDLSDAIALGTALTVGDLKAVVEAGAKGVGEVPAEIKDISLAEALELAAVLPELLKIVKS